MTGSYRIRRITQPIALFTRPRDPAIDSRAFTCYRLVTAGDVLVALQLQHSDNRMFAFSRLA